MLFDPDVVSRFADCGVTLLDAPVDVFLMALAYLGRDPNSEDLDDLAAAEAKLLEVRPYIRYFSSQQYVTDLVNGQVCVALTWNGQAFQARDRAREAGNGVDIAYSIPTEDSVTWFDTFAMPIDAPHPENAHRFLDYLMEPEVIAAISNQRGYGNANVAALAYVEESVREDPGIYPPPDIRKHLFPDLAKPPSYMRKLNRAFTRVKTGR
jgi:putrescine transport system substrate-binding protein